MRVFVSYTTKDPAVSKEKLLQVEALISPFAKVFIDLLHNKRGNQRRVECEVKRCDVFLHLTSPDYESDWVKKELLLARKKKKTVIKIGIEELLGMSQEDVFLLLSDVDKKGLPYWLIFILAIIGCVVFSLITLFFSYKFVAGQLDSNSGVDLLNARGLFGDSWGSVNAIISAFAFAGVIVTLLLQNNDLNLQRKEMARQREEFEKENKTLKYQRFENLFYNMLNLQQEIVAGLRYEYGSGTDRRVVMGRDVFRYIFEEVEIKVRGEGAVWVSRYGYREFLNKSGLRSYDKTWVPTHFDHYFRHLYKIIQLVDRQNFSFDESYKYVSLLRGTLSRYELVWIYYNGLNPVYSPFKGLIEKYSLLKNLRLDMLTRTKELDSYLYELGIRQNELNEVGLSSRDFEFYLTDDRSDTTKYFLSAFWKQEDIFEGETRLKKWNELIKTAEERSVSADSR